MANQLELKYGCNPNQKPARIFMQAGELPVIFPWRSSTENPAISTFSTRLTVGSLSGNSKRQLACRVQLHLNMSVRQGRRLDCR